MWRSLRIESDRLLRGPVDRCFNMNFLGGLIFSQGLFCKWDFNMPWRCKLTCTSAEKWIHTHKHKTKGRQLSDIIQNKDGLFWMQNKVPHQIYSNLNLEVYSNMDQNYTHLEAKKQQQQYLWSSLFSFCNEIPNIGSTAVILTPCPPDFLSQLEFWANIAFSNNTSGGHPPPFFFE